MIKRTKYEERVTLKAQTNSEIGRKARVGSKREMKVRGGCEMSKSGRERERVKHL